MLLSACLLSLYAYHLFIGVDGTRGGVGRVPGMVHAAGAGVGPGRTARVPWQGGAMLVKWPAGGRGQALAPAERRQQGQRARASSSNARPQMPGGGAQAAP